MRRVLVIVGLTFSLCLQSIAASENLGKSRETELEGFYLPPSHISWLQLEDIVKNIVETRILRNKRRVMFSEFEAQIEGLPGKTRYQAILVPKFPGVTRENLPYLLQHAIIQKKTVDRLPEFVAHAELTDDGPGELKNFVWSPQNTRLHLDEIHGEGRINRRVQLTYQFFIEGIEDHPFLIMTLVPVRNPFVDMAALPLEHYLRLQNMKMFASALR